MSTQGPITELVSELLAIEERQLDPILVHRHIFGQFADATQPYVGSQNGAVLSDWIARNYLAFAITAVRRMLDKRRDAHSFIPFLQNVKQHRAMISRQRMRKKFVDALPEFAGKVATVKADEMFDYGVGQPGENDLTRRIIDADIATLEQASEKVTRIANSWIAHDSKLPTVSTLSYGELHAAIDTLESIFSRYHALIMGRKPLFSPFEAFDCREDFQKLWPPNS